MKCEGRGDDSTTLHTTELVQKRYLPQFRETAAAKMLCTTPSLTREREEHHEMNGGDNATAAATEVRALPSDSPKEKKFCISFNDFDNAMFTAACEDEEGHLESSVFTCFQADWCVVVSPGEGYDEFDVGIMMSKGNGNERNMKYSIEVQESAPFGPRRIQPGVGCFAEDEIHGCLQIGTRPHILKSCLERKALKVYVTLQLKEYIPKNPAYKMMLNLFCNEESADIVFEVCNQLQKRPGDQKRAKTSSDTYHAHRCILQQYSTELAALCATSEGKAPVIIDDIKPAVFHQFLYYLYGGEIKEDDFVEHGKDLISVADKYGVPNLKLEAEAWYLRAHHKDFS